MRNDDTVGRPFSGTEKANQSTRDVRGLSNEDQPYPSSPLRSEAPVVYEELDRIPLSRGRAWQPLSILAAVVIIVLGVILPNPFTALTPEGDDGKSGMVSEPIARHRMVLPVERPRSAAQAIPEHARAAGTRTERVRSPSTQ